MKTRITGAKRQMLAELLGRGQSDRQASEELKIDRKAIARIRKDPKFVAEIKSASDAWVVEWRGRLPALIPITFTAAQEILKSGNYAAKAKLIALIWHAMGIGQDAGTGPGQSDRIEFGEAQPPE